MDIAQILSSPIWQGVGAIASVIALVLYIYTEFFKNKFSTSSLTKENLSFILMVSASGAIIFPPALLAVMAFSSTSGLGIISLGIMTIVLFAALGIFLSWAEHDLKIFLGTLGLGITANLSMFLTLLAVSIFWDRARTILVEVIRLLGLG